MRNPTKVALLTAGRIPRTSRAALQMSSHIPSFRKLPLRERTLLNAYVALLAKKLVFNASNDTVWSALAQTERELGQVTIAQHVTENRDERR